MIQGLALVVATCAVGVKGQTLASWSFLGEGDMVLVVGHADDLPGSGGVARRHISRARVGELKWRSKGRPGDRSATQRSSVSTACTSLSLRRARGWVADPTKVIRVRGDSGTRSSVSSSPA